MIDTAKARQALQDAYDGGPILSFKEERRNGHSSWVIEWSDSSVILRTDVLDDELAYILATHLHSTPAR